MNRSLKVLACVFAASCLLAAQEAAKASDFEMPDPKHAEHAPLAALAGDWEFTMKIEALPGVPGMEEATTCTGTEHADLVCNGLWLKSSIDSVYKDAPFQGLWLAGYDPFKKKYTSFWVSSDEQECDLAKMDGTYDAATKTWTWNGSTPHGDVRSIYAMKGPDESLETCFLKTPDGKEVKCMEFSRKRAKAARAAPAVKTAVKLTETKVPAEHALLHQDLGAWDATVKTTAPGMPPSEDAATEVVNAICNGRWTWSDFRGKMMGAPFEGHALCGYVPSQKKYVGVWIDSMTATAVQTSGDFDAARKRYSLTGSGCCPMGKDLKVTESLTWKDDNTRHLEMEFAAEGQTSRMEILYRRKAAR